MISCILIILSVIFLAVMFSAIFRRGFAQTVPLAVILDVLIVYAAGLFGLAKIGVYAAFGISVVCLVFALVISIGGGDGRALFFNVFSVGFVIFLITAAAVFVLSRDVALDHTVSDKYTLKTIYSLISDGSFKNVPEAAGIAVPPGYAVFIYMFTALTGRVTDSNMITGAGIFVMAMILPVLGKINWRKGYLALAAFPLAFAALTIGGRNFPVYNAVNADAGAILVFAMMLVTYMCCEQCGYVYWTLGLGSALLCIIRPGGELLAILMLVIIIIDIAALGFYEVGELFAAPSKWISVVFYFLITAFIFASWWIYAGRNGFGRLFKIIRVTPERALGFSGRLGQVFKALISGKAILPYFLWIVIFIVICAGAAFLAEGFWNRVRTGIQAAIVLLAFIVFLFILAFAYTYVYPITANVKETVDWYITGFIIAMLLYSVNTIVNKFTDRFFA